MLSQFCIYRVRRADSLGGVRRRWVDAKNSTELTRKWYASHLRFPLNFYYPSVWEEAARRRLAAVCDFDATPEAVEAYVSGTDTRCCARLRTLVAAYRW